MKEFIVPLLKEEWGLIVIVLSLVAVGGLLWYTVIHQGRSVKLGLVEIGPITPDPNTPSGNVDSSLDGIWIGNAEDLVCDNFNKPALDVIYIIKAKLKESKFVAYLDMYNRKDKGYLGSSELEGIFSRKNTTGFVEYSLTSWFEKSNVPVENDGRVILEIHDDRMYGSWIADRRMHKKGCSVSFGAIYLEKTSEIGPLEKPKTRIKKTHVMNKQDPSGFGGGSFVDDFLEEKSGECIKIQRKNREDCHEQTIDQ